MDLNVELGVTVRKIDYDNSSRQYTVAIKSPDGTERVVTSCHVVLATRLINDTPARPEFENESSFAGQIPDLNAKKVVMIGADTSGHDIAQDFVTCGAKAVTMVRRVPLFVLSQEAQDKFVLAGWQLMPTKDADLVGGSFPFLIAMTLIVGATQMMAQHDAELLSAMEKSGMAIKRGEDGIGLLHHQLLKVATFILIRAHV
jgi:cation diffusion facilitator CzcD-associated flavoprotein CzcO